MNKATVMSARSRDKLLCVNNEFLLTNSFLFVVIGFCKLMEPLLISRISLNHFSVKWLYPIQEGLLCFL